MRSKKLSTAVWVVASLALAALVASGCASKGSSSGSEGSSASSQPAKAAPPKGVAPPAGHRMAKVQMNMTPEQVQQVMGAPTGQKSYPSAKMFNPFNYGNDSGSRVEYAYRGDGRVIFAVPRWGGSMKVVRIDYDPSEDGN